jgi:hypothetical protein
MGFPKIMPPANLRLAEPISLEKLRRAIDKGPQNKASGADGIVNEFYGHFWDVITTDLLTIYNSILRNRDLHSAQTLGTTVSVPKRQAPRTMNDYFALSLHNTD